MQTAILKILSFLVWILSETFGRTKQTFVQ